MKCVTEKRKVAGSIPALATSEAIFALTGNGIGPSHCRVSTGGPVQNISHLGMHLPRGRLLCQLWDHHPAWLRTAVGFRFARPLYCPDELPGSVGVWPDALADDFRTHASFQGAAGRFRVGGVVPSKEMPRTAAAAARRSNRCRIVSGCGGRPSRG